MEPSLTAPVSAEAETPGRMAAAAAPAPARPVRARSWRRSTAVSALRSIAFVMKRFSYIGSSPEIGSTTGCRTAPANAVAIHPWAAGRQQGIPHGRWPNLAESLYCRATSDRLANRGRRAGFRAASAPGSCGPRPSGLREGPLPDQPPVPLRAVLEEARLGVVVDPHDAEPLRVAVRPLEVVHERPDEVAAHVDALPDHVEHRLQVPPVVVDAVRVVHLAVLHPVGEGGTVLGDHERQVRVALVQGGQQVREALRLDVPAHLGV